jgi:hypothetical protein
MSAFAALKGSIFKAIGLCADFGAYHPHLTPGQRGRCIGKSSGSGFGMTASIPFPDLASRGCEPSYCLRRAAPFEPEKAHRQLP